MSDGRDKLWKHIQRLKGIDRAMSDPSAFFESHRGRYLAMARTITQGVLSLVRPADIEAAEWNFRISTLAAAIAAELLSGEQIGLVLFLDARKFEQLKFEDFARGTFAKDTILAWVRAGRTEDPLGKQMDERDLGDTDDTIAARVWWALYTGRSRNSAEHIRAYLAGKTQDAVMAHLDAVLAAWQETIGVAARKDWRAFMQTTIRGA